MRRVYLTYFGIGLAADRLPSSEDTVKLLSQSSSASGIVYKKKKKNDETLKTTELDGGVKDG